MKWRGGFEFRYHVRRCNCGMGILWWWWWRRGFEFGYRISRCNRRDVLRRMRRGGLEFNCHMICCNRRGNVSLRRRRRFGFVIRTLSWLTIWEALRIGPLRRQFYQRFLSNPPFGLSIVSDQWRTSSRLIDRPRICLWCRNVC